ncbi:hypothetical protein, partial [Bacillus cereus group sp. BC72]|uniref:hypothetical protein n=1 Tax=Bacillus cereus group sp. BC72 TaxID=3445272 RepID=UPI003F255E29
DGDQIYDDPISIQDHIVGYYTNLFARTNFSSDTGLISRVIPSLVTDEENDILTKVPTEEEILSAVKLMDLSSAPGPDGFNGQFFIS